MQLINRTNANEAVNGNIKNMMELQRTGQFNREALAKRERSAQEVASTYDIYACGDKTNGWGEKVSYFLVLKANKRYEVQIRSNGQPSCNCPDWRNHRGQTGGFCKHGLAVIATLKKNAANLGM